jgi:hypothetical protein
MTVEEVIRTRFSAETTLYERVLQSLSNLIPGRYFYLADLVLLLFWAFLYMTFLRVFTFMGYGRAFRASLFLGACTYYFMPDFSPGKTDDLIFIGIALLLILFRAHLSRKKKKAPHFG